MEEQPLSEMYEALKAPFQVLADENKLSRCMQLVTQNANESFHSTLWKWCPKDSFVGKSYLGAAIANAVMQWNSGAASATQAANFMGLTPSPKVIQDAHKKEFLTRRSSLRLIKTGNAKNYRTHSSKQSLKNWKGGHHTSLASSRNGTHQTFISQ